jgi:Arc/MetJ family transcription regulator
MNLNISVDDILMTTAIKFGGLETEKDTVNAALEEFIETRKRMDFLSIARTIDFDDDWDYRKIRGKVLKY